MKKTQFYQSFALVAALIIFNYSCDTQNPNDTTSEEPENTEEQQGKYEVTKEQYELLQFLAAEESSFPKGKPDVFPDTTGGLITLEAARKKYKLFTEMNGTKPQIQPYAFGFGLQEMRQFLDKIDNISDANDSNSHITGVRVYLTANQKPAFKHLDILMIPVNIKGDDLFELDSVSFLDEEIILNSSLPCPKNCTN